MNAEDLVSHRLAEYYLRNAPSLVWILVSDARIPHRRALLRRDDARGADVPLVAVRRLANGDGVFRALAGGAALAFVGAALLIPVYGACGARPG